MKENKSKSLSDLISSLNGNNKEIKVIKSGIYPIDTICNGGLELGSFVQFVAESGVGKTTMALGLSYALCNKGFNILYIDAEKSVSNEILDTTKLKSFLNERFILIKEAEFSVVEDYLDQFIATGEINFVIIDSLAALINSCFTSISNGKKNKISITTNNTSYNSVPLTKFMDKYKSIAGSNKVCFIFINQYRNKINMTSGAKEKEYGSKNTIYNCDVLIKIDKASIYKEKNFYDLTKDVETGIPLVFEIVKSNKSRPGIAVPAFLDYGKGISSIWNYIYELIKIDVISKNGSYYNLSYDKKDIKAQGVKNFVKELKLNHLLNLKILEDLVNENKVINIELDDDGFDEEIITNYNDVAFDGADIVITIDEEEI